ncbi:NusG domain II-containing protein [Natranaerofaba carboxydovora]|uniref:NusG domain II-containing protein n=1 Tax=Natranaerofaba carboxydovora TaxID=2742683 RepID=UPI001F1304FA|nr:NusG domain II-containing protein [Natranaerofaba carboxydovora]UMZ75158.1 NusG domain II [Natranaerofaba carboxydovora]
MEIKSYLKYIKLGDIIITVFLIASVIVSSGWFWFGNDYNERVVIVEVEGQVVEEMSFPSEGEEKVVTVDVPRGEANIELENNRVRVQRMPRETCPQGICADTGWIEHTGQTIACVPNQMVVYIETPEDEEREFDGITG